MVRTNRSLKIIPLLLIVAIVVVVLCAWAIPAWMADIELDKQLYTNKAGGVDFVEVNMLNWAKLWAPLIPAALVTAFLIYPKKFLSILRISSNAGRVRLGIVFSIIVFGVSYLINWLSGELSYGMFMAQYLQNDPSFVSFWDSFKALSIPFDPSAYNINVLLTWKTITMPIFNAILTAVLIRMIMEMIGARVNGGYAIEFLGRLFLSIGIVLAYFYLAAPLSAYDSIERTQLYILPLTMWTLISVGLFGLIFSAVSKTYRDREEIAGASFILTIIVVIAMVIVPCIAAAGDYFSRELRYEQLVWNGRVGWETNQTRVASDLTSWDHTKNLTALLSLPTNPEIVNKVRPFDKTSSNALIEAQITTPYETKGDTDIIAINNTNYSEYWIAPRVFYEDDQSFGSAVNRHMVFTSTQGFVAMDAHNGSILTPANCVSAFGVNNSYPFYFGEGYRNDLILGVSGYREKNGGTYNGAPDAVLGGYLGSLKVLGMSTDFINLMNQDIKFLHRTNIVDRVQGMLLPYMYMDEDPYLIFNRENGTISYCVPLYISIPGFTYFKTDYRRFLGWVLVDVKYGTMSFYRTPKLDDVSEISELISFAQVYLNTAMYPWQNLNTSSLTPSVKSQLRYPENFYEAQLETDYIYHVRDWQVWHDKTDFFDRPADGDLYYVMMDLGENLEFVGMELVVPTSGTTALAGMYVLRNRLDQDGVHFGETIFYSTLKGTTLIGPSTAEQALLSNSVYASALVLVPGRDTGNILLYDFAGSLYYIIPIYSTVTIQTLKYIGLVNGFDQTEVVMGDNATDAFTKLAALHQVPTPPAQIELNSTGPASVTSPALANVSLVVQNTVANMSIPAQNFSVSMYVYSQNSSLLIKNLPQTPKNFTDTAYAALGIAANYSIGNWSLLPSESDGLTAQLGLTLGNFSSRNVPYRFVVTLPNGTRFSGPLRSVTFNSPSHAATNITGSNVTLGFTLPTAVVEPNRASLVLSVKNVDTNFGNPAVNVKVNLTLFSVNGTVTMPGMISVESASFTSDPMYAGIPGENYTVIDEDLSPQGNHGITVLLDLDITGNTRVELVYRLSLIVNDVVVETTLLRVITWTT